MGGNLPLGNTGFILNYNLYTKDDVAEVDSSVTSSAGDAEWRPLKNGGSGKKRKRDEDDEDEEKEDPNAFGVKCRVGKDKIQMEFDLTGQKGESQSGLTNIICSAKSAPIPGTNLVCTG